MASNFGPKEFPNQAILTKDEEILAFKVHRKHLPHLFPLTCLPPKGKDLGGRGVREIKKQMREDARARDIWGPFLTEFCAAVPPGAVEGCGIDVILKQFQEEWKTKRRLSQQLGSGKLYPGKSIPMLNAICRWLRQPTIPFGPREDLICVVQSFWKSCRKERKELF